MQEGERARGRKGRREGDYCTSAHDRSAPLFGRDGSCIAEDSTQQFHTMVQTTETIAM